MPCTPLRIFWELSISYFFLKICFFLSVDSDVVRWFRVSFFLKTLLLYKVSPQLGKFHVGSTSNKS